MAASKPGNESERKQVAWECPNPGNEGQPYTLTQLLEMLKDKTFAQFFLGLLKRAEDNEKIAIECVNSYLAPTVLELENLGIPPSRIENFRRCTDSGVLVMVTAQQNS